MLVYYDVSQRMRELGRLDIRQCRGIVPGWRCKVEWHSNSQPNLRFGLFMPDREVWQHGRCGTSD